MACMACMGAASFSPKTRAAPPASGVPAPATMSCRSGPGPVTSGGAGLDRADYY